MANRDLYARSGIGAILVLLSHDVANRPERAELGTISDTRVENRDRRRARRSAGAEGGRELLRGSRTTVRFR